LSTMQPKTIIWDFDGTLLPRRPYDSEQFLLLHLMRDPVRRMSFVNRLITRAMVWADRHEFCRVGFKKWFARITAGEAVGLLDRIAVELAPSLSTDDRAVLCRLYDSGYRMMVVSCGTIDLAERILLTAGLGHCFESIEGNRFQLQDGIIGGVERRIPHPRDKVAWAVKQGLTPEDTIAVGDGYTDIPLLDWAGVPVMIDRTGSRRGKREPYRLISAITEIETVIEST